MALTDASRVAEDFVVLRTARHALQAFLEQFDFGVLGDVHKPLLIVSASATRSGPTDVLDLYDAGLQRRLEMQIDPSAGYRIRAGREYPAAGLRVISAREAITLPPRE